MEHRISLNKYQFNMEQLQLFYGDNHKNITFIEKKYNCEVIGNGNELCIYLKEDNLSKICKMIDVIIKKVLKNDIINESILQDIYLRIEDNLDEIDENIRFVTTYNGKIIRPKNHSQLKYLKLLEKNTIIFALGAAGSGKTYLAVAYGISQLKQKKVSKIVITRPIVEAGENLGFLPGELKEKVDPYLIPIYDALYDIIGKETTLKYLEKGIIEIAPLAYMRGRTLNDSFVILDEAQNTTSAQMKMFLTRLGYQSKMVITGDQTQIDLKPTIPSGIIVASKLLNGIEEIDSIIFNSKDVVRHPLVSKIIQAYEENVKVD